MMGCVRVCVCVELPAMSHLGFLMMFACESQIDIFLSGLFVICEERVRKWSRSAGDLWGPRVYGVGGAMLLTLVRHTEWLSSTRAPSVL